MMTLKKDKHICFFDIDGTLALGKEIPESTKKSITQLRNQGDLVFICTGRPYHYVKEFFNEWADGFITSNGRYIIYKDDILLDEPLNDEQVQHFVKVMREHNCGFAFIGNENGYLESSDPKLKDMIIQSYFDGYFITDFKDNDIKGYMFDIYYPDQVTFDGISEVLKDEIIFNPHYPHFSADATILGIDKGIGIDKVLDYFHMNKENAYAFGDGSNDLCMFSHVGHSVAMGNGIEQLKKEAEFVTASINEDGIEVALKHYKLI